MAMDDDESELATSAGAEEEDEEEVEDVMAALLSEKVLELKDTVQRQDAEIARLRAETARLEGVVAMNGRWQREALDLQRQNETLRAELASSGREDDGGGGAGRDGDAASLARALRAAEGEIERMRIGAVAQEQQLQQERRAWQKAVDEIGSRLEALSPLS